MNLPFTLGHIDRILPKRPDQGSAVTHQNRRAQSRCLEQLVGVPHQRVREVHPIQPFRLGLVEQS